GRRSLRDHRAGGRLCFNQHCGRLRARHVAGSHYPPLHRPMLGGGSTFHALPNRAIAGFDDFKSEISDLKSMAESISRQLRGWADSLQNSEIKGQRYLTEKSRQAERASHDRELLPRRAAPNPRAEEQ